MTKDELTQVMTRELQTERHIVANCTKVMELLKPEFDKFEAREEFNQYIVRMYVDHKNEKQAAMKKVEAILYFMDLQTLED